jgi:hypothetical protein
VAYPDSLSGYSAPPPGYGGHRAPDKRRGKVWLIIIGLVVVLAAGAVAVLLLGGSSKPKAPTGMLDPTTLAQSVQESYQADIESDGGTISDVTCIPKPAPRTFSCLITASTSEGDEVSASHEVVVNAAGTDWVTSS